MSDDKGEKKGFLDKAKEAAGDLAEKSKPALGKAKEKSGPALDKAGDVATGLFGKAKGLFKKDAGGSGDDA